MRTLTSHFSRCVAAIVGVLLGAAVVSAQESPYFPAAAGQWRQVPPAQAGMDAALLAKAIAFAQEHESKAPRDLALAHELSFGREPVGEALGPFRQRGDVAGVIVRRGRIVAVWGDPDRVDMTFSVTKSFLSTVVGLAVDQGLIADLHDPVRKYMPTDHFDAEHNRGITWDQLLRQTSDWEGELWGKPDWADRPTGDPREWPTPERHEPGSAWEYNDVRVNLLALAALHVWRRPLPQVLKEYVMDPIGASNTWRWEGYRNSWITLDGLRMQSVSGGGHWGGGMMLNAYDQARFGYFTLRRGRWGNKRLLSEGWFETARTPTGPRPGYGFMNYFLNTGREALPSAPETAYAHRGAGANVIYVDEENDLVAVVRWIEGDAVDGFVERVLAAIRR